MQIPIGGEMQVRVVVRDEVGQIFTTLDGLALDYQLDQPDIISVRREPLETGVMKEGRKEGPSIYLIGLQEGHAILRVFTLGQPMLDDYLEVTLHLTSNLNRQTTCTKRQMHFIQVSVGQAILPRVPLVHVGGSIFFGITLSPHPELIIRNLWASDNPAVLQ